MEKSVPHVEFQGVSKHYGQGDLIVDRLDLEIRQGEFLTLLGPSGSGKTTCLMMLAGFELPTAGAIRIHGKSVERLSPQHRGLGVVFQNYALFPHMTIAANLAFPLEARRIAKPLIVERVNKVLRMVRLEGLADRYPKELSGGQQQRVAIARALVFEADLVLMDEPLGALDRRLREEMQYEIRQMQRDLEITVLYVTHDQEEAMVMSDRIAVFNEGCIEQIAEPEVLYEEPERRFVAHFIGENNMLDARVVSLQDDTCFVECAGHKIRALPIADCEVGQEVSVAIRPERIGIAPESGLYSNEVEAEVLHCGFLGDHLRLRLSVCGRSDFIAKIPNIVGHGGVLEGDRIQIGWLQADCRVLEAAKKNES